MASSPFSPVVKLPGAFRRTVSFHQEASPFLELTKASDVPKGTRSNRNVTTGLTYFTT